jgi:hypothetical protein
MKVMDSIYDTMYVCIDGCDSGLHYKVCVDGFYEEEYGDGGV